MKEAFVAFQEGHRDERIDALRYAALTEAAYEWPLLHKQKIPDRHPLYGKVGPPYYFCRGAVDAHEHGMVPIYIVAGGYVAVEAGPYLLSIAMK